MVIVWPLAEFNISRQQITCRVLLKTDRKEKGVDKPMLIDTRLRFG
jgi:hypothetical protein